MQYPLSCLELVSISSRTTATQRSCLRGVVPLLIELESTPASRAESSRRVFGVELDPPPAGGGHDPTVVSGSDRQPCRRVRAGQVLLGRDWHMQDSVDRVPVRSALRAPGGPGRIAGFCDEAGASLGFLKGHFSMLWRGPGIP